MKIGILGVGHLARAAALGLADPPAALEPVNAEWVRRALRLEVAERMDATGQVLAEVPEDEAAEVLDRLAAAGIESLAICFLNAYRNGVNEARLREFTAMLEKSLLR